jgi:Mg-chelatase subunit ChlD
MPPPFRPAARALAALCLLVAGLAAQVRAEDLARQIARWQQYWHAGKIDLDAPVPGPALSRRLYGEGVVPEQTQRPMRHRDALTRMLDLCRAHQTAGVTRAVLELAGTGRDGGRVAPERAPQLVRRTADRVLAQLSSPGALDAMVAASEPGERRVGVRVAALHALGAVRPPVARVFAERQLGDRERLVRLAAAEAVGARAHPDSLDDLVPRIAGEDDPVVLQAVVMAAHRILRERGAAADPAAAVRATGAAIDALGRAGDWRADLAIVEFLLDARTARAIPALIDVLERFTRGRTADSAILRERTHATLVSLTGTRRDAADIAGWRRFWDEVRDGFQVAPRVEARADAGATSAGFFGIPIRGSRILFVIDVSGSMNAKLAAFDEGRTSAQRGAAASRLDWAKRELRAAASSLPADARFGVIVFSSGVQAWNRSLLPPSREVLAALGGMLQELGAGGATNLYGALDLALDLSGATHGSVDADGIDELFVLTDGQPSAGEVTSTDAILAAVRDANRYRRARIHAVSLGGNAQFLRQLAEENDGTFVAR